MLFRKLADENADIDPDDDQRAPFVAKALIALAGYVRSGVREIGVTPNPRRAANYLHHAAIFFGDKDAQFELAKLYLNGEGGSDDVRRGLHYLSTLSEQSYPARAGAAGRAALAAGGTSKADQRRALALITMAAENAPAHDRIWIEDIYHSIFCATTQGTRTGGRPASWPGGARCSRGRSPAADRAGLGRPRAAAGAAVLQRRSGRHPPGSDTRAAATGRRLRQRRPAARPCKGSAAYRSGFRAGAGRRSRRPQLARCNRAGSARASSSTHTGTWSEGFSQPRVNLSTPAADEAVGGLRREQDVVDADAVVLLPGAGLVVPERVDARRPGGRRAAASVRPRLSSDR